MLFRSDVTLTVVKLDQMYPALKAGRIDGFNTTAPANNRAVSEGIAVWAARPSQGEVPGLKDFLYTALCAKPDFLAKNGDVARRTVRAIAKASDLITSNPAQAGRMLQQAFLQETDLALVQSVVADQRSTVSVPIKLTQAMFDQNLDFVQRFDKLDKAVSFAEVMDARWLTDAAQ